MISLTVIFLVAAAILGGFFMFLAYYCRQLRDPGRHNRWGSIFYKSGCNQAPETAADTVKQILAGDGAAYPAGHLRIVTPSFFASQPVPLNEVLEDAPDGTEA